MKVIEDIETLAEEPDTNELHELQPVFETGLWIFGPEYEGVKFFSNKSLSAIVREFFKGSIIEDRLKRHDFVALPDTSIGVYSGDEFDANGEVCGIDRVLIVELKRGGYKITEKELWQTLNYATAIKNSGKITQNTRMTCFVLGTTVESNEALKKGDKIEITPRTYSTILRQAHARTFNLMKKIKEIKRIGLDDNEIKEIISQSEITDFGKEPAPT